MKRTPKPEQFPRQGGFSLVELVLTLVILSILAAVAVPRFFGTGDTFRERGYHDELLGSLRYAQQYAMATGCGVLADIVATGYQLRRPALADCGSVDATDFTVVMTRPDRQPFTGNAPGAIAHAPAQIIFRPSGAASAGATIATGSRNITVVAASGFVTD